MGCTTKIEFRFSRCVCNSRASPFCRAVSRLWCRLLQASNKLVKGQGGGRRKISSFLNRARCMLSAEALAGAYQNPCHEKAANVLPSLNLANLAADAWPGIPLGLPTRGLQILSHLKLPKSQNLRLCVHSSASCQGTLAQSQWQRCSQLKPVWKRFQINAGPQRCKGLEVRGCLASDWGS